MNANISLQPNIVHLWRVWLPDLIPQVDELSRLLSPDELARAARFRFPIHKQRYIIARGVLRQLLNRYTHIPAHEIEFEYGPKGKPYLRHNLNELQFNVSHSHDIAVYAFTLKHEIGVDIEKIEKDYQDSVAKRFFSASEYEALNTLPEEERREGFYQLWAAKEALIKAVGQGLYIGLNEFSVSVCEKKQDIVFKDRKFHIESFSVHEEYRSAFATAQEVKAVILSVSEGSF